MSALTNFEANRLPDWQGPYQLYIKVASAALTRSTDLLGKMDPFAQIEFCRPSGSNTLIKKIRGPTHKGGHKQPVWNFECLLYFGGESAGQGSNNSSGSGSVGGITEKLKIAVYEEDLTTNDFVGECEPIAVSQYLGRKQVQTQQFLFSQGKPVGSCLLEI